MEREWEQHAACLGTDSDLFFNEDNEAEAKRTCEDCPVRFDCLADHMHWEYRQRLYHMGADTRSGRTGRSLMAGVFGGLSPTDRWHFVHAIGLDNVGRIWEDEDIEAPQLVERMIELWSQ